MNIVIVYAHPHHNSLNGAIFESIIQNINSRHSVKVIDLYEEQFNPILFMIIFNLFSNLDRSENGLGVYPLVCVIYGICSLFLTVPFFLIMLCIHIFYRFIRERDKND